MGGSHAWVLSAGDPMGSPRTSDPCLTPQRPRGIAECGSRQVSWLYLSVGSGRLFPERPSRLLEGAPVLPEL